MKRLLVPAVLVLATASIVLAQVAPHAWPRRQRGAGSLNSPDGLQGMSSQITLEVDMEAGLPGSAAEAAKEITERMRRGKVYPTMSGNHSWKNLVHVVCGVDEPSNSVRVTISVYRDCQIVPDDPKVELVHFRAMVWRSETGWIRTTPATARTDFGRALAESIDLFVREYHEAQKPLL